MRLNLGAASGIPLATRCLLRLINAVPAEEMKNRVEFLSAGRDKDSPPNPSPSTVYRTPAVLRPPASASGIVLPSVYCPQSTAHRFLPEPPQPRPPAPTARRRLTLGSTTHSMPEVLRIMDTNFSF